MAAPSIPQGHRVGLGAYLARRTSEVLGVALLVAAAGLAIALFGHDPDDASINLAAGTGSGNTHNLAEGAGAAALAALIAERESQAGRRVGVVLSGGNIYRTAFAKVLAAEKEIMSSPEVIETLKNFFASLI